MKEAVILTLLKDPGLRMRSIATHLSCQVTDLIPVLYELEGYGILRSENVHDMGNMISYKRWFVNRVPKWVRV